jgi:UDP-N-acetylmuramoyl-L-alanyl-D-glutamate--2,6-diaminopimelate ligase
MRAVRTAGVTGTNGKTTVTWLVRSILHTAGHACGLLGTVEYSDGLRTDPAGLTTPDSKTFWDWFAAMAAAHTPFAAVELSSHALHQERVAGSELEAAVVTNVTHDHLDYHGTAAGYLASKSKILSLVRPGGTVILNQDDPAIDALRPRVPAGIDVMTFALKRRAAVTADDIRPTAAGQRFILSLRGRRIDVETRLVGHHNVANCLAAAAVASEFGLSADEIEAGLRQATAPPGRMQRISSGEPVEVFVDYAHTPDALEKAIATVRNLTVGRVIVVFGAGGDRDRSKRPSLGAAASAANVAVVTSDNPRSEVPERIIADVLSGLNNDRCEAYVEPDRAMAIAIAVAAAEPGDVILIAGKGHETTQTLADHTIPFDDRIAAAVALRERFGTRNPGKAAA